MPSKKKGMSRTMTTMKTSLIMMAMKMDLLLRRCKHTMKKQPTTSANCVHIYISCGATLEIFV